MELTREHFRAIIFHNFRRALSRQDCFDPVKLHPIRLLRTGIMNLIMAEAHSVTNFVKDFQKRSLCLRTLIPLKN
uniref:Uncharacterized protein n=1 Tax=Anopheles funestus TaxID=62324 RepID=A0A182RUD8_ANOFN